MTWSCYDDLKGFHVYDTDTRLLTFVPNSSILFNKIWYDDTNMTYEDLNGIAHSGLEDSYIKLIIKEKNNPVMFDSFISLLEDYNPIHLQVVDDHLNLDLDDDADIIDEAEDTMTILDGYIEGLDLKYNKKELKNLMHGLYNEALAVE